jgi:hypothetical protein
MVSRFGVCSNAFSNHSFQCGAASIGIIVIRVRSAMLIQSTTTQALFQVERADPAYIDITHPIFQQINWRNLSIDTNNSPGINDSVGIIIKFVTSPRAIKSQECVHRAYFV